jgi:hypothetical protein
MAYIERSNNEKPVNDRYHGNWRTNAAKVALGIGVPVLAGYGAYKGLKYAQFLKDKAEAISDMKAILAMNPM